MGRKSLGHLSNAIDKATDPVDKAKLFKEKHRVLDDLDILWAQSDDADDREKDVGYCLRCLEDGEVMWIEPTHRATLTPATDLRTQSLLFYTRLTGAR